MSSERALLKGALLPTLILAAISISLSTYIWGSSGAVGSLLAQFIVIVFFASNLAVARLAREFEPRAIMAAAMVSYFSKIILLGIFLGLVTTFIPEDICNRNAFVLSAVGATFAWLGGEIVAFLKLKLHLQLPPVSPYSGD